MDNMDTTIHHTMKGPVPRGTGSSASKLKMMKTLLFSALITLVIASFAGAQSSGPTEEEAAKNRARPYFEGLEALKRYRESEECENSDSRTVLAELKELE